MTSPEHNGRLLAFFLRHGESRSNATPGRDLPDVEGDRLTELGHRQAELAAREVAELGVTRLWASSMRRAQETAAPVAERLGLEVEVHDDLREIDEGDDYGDLPGEEQRLRRWSERMAAPAPPPAGAETFADAYARVERVKRLLLEAGDERVLAVSHGIFMRFFAIHTLLGDRFGPGDVATLWQLRTANCGLCAFEHGPPGTGNPAPEPWRVLTWMARPWDPV